MSGDTPRKKGLVSRGEVVGDKTGEVPSIVKEVALRRMRV